MTARVSMAIFGVRGRYMVFLPLHRDLLSVRKTGLSEKRPPTVPSLTTQLASIAREGGLILLAGACLFLLLALIGYDPRDPGWSHLAYQPEVKNFTGTAGAWMADGMISAFGVGAYLLPLLVLWPAWRYLRQVRVGIMETLPFLMLRSLGAAIFLLALCTLSSIHLSNDSLHYPFTVGGLLGEATSDWAVSWFSVTGSSILFWTLMLLGLTLFLEFSWQELLELLGGALLRMVDQLRGRLPLTTADEPAIANNAFARAADSPDVAPRVSRPVSPAPAMHERIEPRMEPSIAENTVIPSSEESTTTAKAAMAKTSAAAGAVAEAAKRSLKIVPLSETHQPMADEPDSEPTPVKRKQLPRLPSLDLLDPPELQQQQGYSEDELEQMSRLLESKLKDFGVVVEVVEVNPGPVITRFELQPAPGVKASKISNLSRDLARSMAVMSVRVVEVIPGKSVVGVEIPNEVRQTVHLSEVLNARPYLEASSRLTLALGNDIAGNPVVANLAKMPHLLVAGTTGSGKSVGVNAMLLSLLLKATPEEVRLILVDPKMLELSVYEGVPHLLTPVITDMKEAAGGLRWCVAEMERRYRLMAKMGVRNIAGFNDKVIQAQEAGKPIPDPLWNPQEYGLPDDEPAPTLETLPYIVVVIDEFADMMMMVGKKVEELIARIAQKARAAGIHLILATQRPSVDVITGLIKANIPTRIAFQVSSKIDSRTILDQGGAESLLGYGDMLYVPAGTSIPNRVHGAFVSDDEVHRVVEQWKLLGEPNYIDVNLSDGSAGDGGSGGDLFDDEQDPLYDEAVAFVTESRKASISSVQRKLKIGYNRAARMIETMEAAGVVSEAGSNGQREVLAPPPPRN